MLIVMIISILFFLFIVVDNMWLRMVLRLLLIPIVAGVAYEFIRLAGRSDSTVVEVFSKPGLWLQSLTTSEPDDDMIEVAIASVDAVFDWKSYIASVQEEMAAEEADAMEESTVGEESDSNEEVVAGETEEISVEESVEETVATEEVKAESAEDDLEMVDLAETEEDDEILQNLDYVFVSPESEDEN